MSVTEKVLIAAILLFGLSGLMHFGGVFPFFLLTNLSVVFLCIHYITKTRVSIWTVVLVLIIVRTVGFVFQVLHLTGAAILQLIGLTGSVMFAFSILWTGKNPVNRLNSIYYLGSIFILLQSLFFMSSDQNMVFYGGLLTYLIVGVIGTIKLRELKAEIGIDKLLNIFLLQGVLTIFHVTINIIR